MARTPTRTPTGAVAGFRTRQEGGVTAFGLITISILLLIAGVAIDVANLYRYQTMLQMAADTAAQGGVVALARGEDPVTARKAALAMVERNLPEAGHGRMIVDPAIDLQLLHYDPATGAVERASEDQPVNAVLVRLQRSAAAGNPLPTFLMGMVGHNSWSLAASSVAVLMPTQRCGNAEGIVARGAVDLGSAPEFATGFCLHSQAAIALPSGTRMDEPLRISLPDPRNCAGLCTADNPVAKARPVALNLVMPGAEGHVARLAAGFLDPRVTLPEEAAFLATRLLQGDPEALREVGLQAEDIRPGTVLQMSPLQFSQLRERPSGLVYDVHCNTIENDPRPAWQRTLSLIGSDFGPTLRDLVLVTDCAIEMDNLVRIEGALILMTGPGEARIEALKGATLGDPAGKCDPARRVRLMALGDLALPAGLALSNVSALAGGNIRLGEGAGKGRVAHRGLVLHAGGAVTADGAHSFARCPAETGSDPLMPAMQVIAHAMPNLAAVLPPPAKAYPKTEMPGQDVQRLPGTAAGRVPMNSETRPES